MAFIVTAERLRISACWQDDDQHPAPHWQLASRETLVIFIRAAQKALLNAARAAPTLGMLSARAYGWCS
jgi:hypothetical protein